MGRICRISASAYSVGSFIRYLRFILLNWQTSSDSCSNFSPSSDRIAVINLLQINYFALQKDFYSIRPFKNISATIPPWCFPRSLKTILRCFPQSNGRTQMTKIRKRLMLQRWTSSNGSMHCPILTIWSTSSSPLSGSLHPIILPWAINEEDKHQSVRNRSTIQFSRQISNTISQKWLKINKCNLYRLNSRIRGAKEETIIPSNQLRIAIT